jgi:hypothetical protein
MGKAAAAMEATVVDSVVDSVVAAEVKVVVEME